MIPVRMFFNGLSMGLAGIWYLSRHSELNRVRRLKFSIDMTINVVVRALAAGIVSDIVTRKVFVNHSKI